MTNTNMTTYTDAAGKSRSVEVILRDSEWTVVYDGGEFFALHSATKNRVYGLMHPDGTSFSGDRDDLLRLFGGGNLLIREAVYGLPGSSSLGSLLC